MAFSNAEATFEDASLYSKLGPELARALPTDAASQSRLSVGMAETIGGRPTMEDRMCECSQLRATEPLGLEFGTEHYFAVFDGHGGKKVADYAADRLHIIVGELLGPRTTEIPCAEYESVLRKSFAQLNAELHPPVSPVPPANLPIPVADRTGCTAVVVIVDGANTIDLPFRLTVANAGDCRAVLCIPRETTAGYIGIRLSVDHKPSTPEERARIEAFPGGSVKITGNGVARVGGVLACSRAIGDLSLKRHGVSAEPHVATVRVPCPNGAAYIVLACDGLWCVRDVVEDNQAATVVKAVFDAGGSAAAAATTLRNLASTRGSLDNISVMVVSL